MVPGVSDGRTDSYIARSSVRTQVLLVTVCPAADNNESKLDNSSNSTRLDSLKIAFLGCFTYDSQSQDVYSSVLRVGTEKAD